MRMRRWLGFGFMLALVIIAAQRVPPRFNPLAPIDLAEPDTWFADFRLAALKSSLQQCQSVLKAPMIAATPVADTPFVKGCGWHNAVAVAQAGSARVGADRMSCEMAAALAMWIAHEVQPAAVKYFGASVKSVQNMGIYSCRNIAGRAAILKFRSQHATANAIDISAFVLNDGRVIRVAKHWRARDAGRDSSEAKFLRAVHKSACRYFRATLGPDYNAAHANHFHLDRGAFKSCR